MKKLIQTRHLQKKLGIAAIIIVVVAICVGIYMVNGISQNVDKMGEEYEDVTYFPEYPPVNTSDKNAELVKKGEYIAKAGDCMACHSNTDYHTKGKPFAGGLAMNTPFGTLYSPNITPDKETGIGGWSDEDFIKAMREGISPQGHYYFPAFPYIYFNKISTEDLRALKAYLDVIPAVKQQNRENEMVFPFNFRFLQLGWRILFFHPDNNGSFKDDPKQSAQWNRGAYLVEGLGHCAMCHSPSYNMFDESLPLGAPIRKYDLTGAKVQGYLAPNITSSNLGQNPESEIVRVFTENKMIGGGKVEGPMLEVNQNSLRYLSNTDLEAIAFYIKNVRSEMPPKPKVGAGGVGKSIYDSYCSGCHATGAAGAPMYGDKLSWQAALKQQTAAIYVNAIKGVGNMPAKGTCLSCSDEEIKQSVDYMLASLKGNEGNKTSPAKPIPLTLEQGKQIYEKNCSSCHTPGKDNALKLGDKKAWEAVVNNGFVPTLENVITGKNGHPPHGSCDTCNDAEIKAAVKYMLQESSTGKDYRLW